MGEILRATSFPPLLSVFYLPRPLVPVVGSPEHLGHTRACGRLAPWARVEGLDGMAYVLWTLE